MKFSLFWQNRIGIIERFKKPNRLLKPMRMDVLLQHSRTALYLKRDLSWTDQREEGYVFISSGEAIDFAIEHHLTEVEIVLFFRDLGHSLVVPFQQEPIPEAANSPAAKSERRKPV
jgi:hypothetical protein